MCTATSHVRFTPNSDRESDIPQKAMSALPPKADMCSATRHVRFVPIADIAATYSITSSAAFSKPNGTVRPSALAVFRLMTKSNLVGLHNWKIGRLFTFEDSSGVIACLPIRIGDAGAVADQAACEGVLSKVIHGGQTILCRERNDTIASGIEVCIGCNEQGADPLLEEKREGSV